MIEPVSMRAAASLLGPEAQISGLGAEAVIAPASPAAPASAGPSGFGGALTDAVKALDGVQKTADVQAQALATGQATDVAAVVVAAERAQLSMQLASGIRNKLVESYNELMRTQI